MITKIRNLAKELRIFIQTSSDIGNKENAKYLEDRIEFEISNLIGNEREKIFSSGVIMGMILGICVSFIVYVQWLL